MDSETNYRIKLLLYHFFHDHRATCYSFIKCEYRVVQDLLNHIKITYQLDNIGLFIRDSYLSPNEDIRIIERHAKVTVKPMTDTAIVPLPMMVDEVSQGIAKEEKSKSKKKKKIIVEDINETDTPNSQNIVKSTVKYFNQLNSSPTDNHSNVENNNAANLTPNNLMQIAQNKETATKKLVGHFSTPEFVTPSVSMENKSKKSNKRKLKNSFADKESKVARITDADMDGEPDISMILPSTSKDTNNGNESESEKPSMHNSSNNKLIQHVTPSRNIQPTTLLKKSINIVSSIIIKNAQKVNEMERSQNENQKSMTDNHQGGHVGVESTSISTSQEPIRSNMKTSTPVMIEPVIVNTTQSNKSRQSEEGCVDVQEVPATSEATSQMPTANANTAQTMKLNNNMITSTPVMSDEAIAHKTQFTESTQAELKCKTLDHAYTPSKKQTSSIAYVLTSLRNNCSLPASTCNDNDHEFNANETKFITRRKRVRQRKPKRQTTPMPATLPKPEYRKPNIEAKPLIHRFFEDNLVEDESILELDNDTDTESVEVIEDLHASLNGNTDSKDKGIKDDDKNIHKVSLMCKSLTPAIIDTLKLMDTIFPKEGDYVVFKMLKLGPGYNPECSNHIVGQVVHFDEMSKQVEFDIIDGLSEFQKPDGVFSLAHDDQVDATEIESKQVLCWSDLIGPRLLFP